MGHVLFPVLFAGWVFALRGAGRIDRTPRAVLAFVFGGGYLAARLLDARAVFLTVALSAVVFALVCFTVLSLLRDSDGIVRWLLAISAGTLLLFLGVPVLEGYLTDMWWQSNRRIEADAATPGEGEGRETE
ncbi:MAG: hypothetical protein ACYTFI_10745 [Planctomycetota bacterium]|jgi:hypothetical protein